MVLQEDGSFLVPFDPNASDCGDQTMAASSTTKKGGDGDGGGGGGPAIGIDLGTTYSCVAVRRHNRSEVITNDQGNRITPSCVAFTAADRFVGDAADNQAALNPTNTIFGQKNTCPFISTMLASCYCSSILQELAGTCTAMCNVQGL